MEKPTRHIVFSPSARGSLVQALKSLGRRDEVVALFDDLRCGPIEPLDPIVRERWFAETLRVDFEPGLVPRWHEEFWAGALDGTRRLVVWTTSHNAQDRLGYLLWASRLGDASGEVVDISDVEFDGFDRSAASAVRRLPVPLVMPDQFVRFELFDLAKPVNADDKVAAAQEVKRLGQDEGAFRQTQDGALVTLPLTAFDGTLIAAASHTFRKAAFVIGTAILNLQERNGWHVSDLVLAARLMVLIEERRLEAQGDLCGSVRHYEVRLP